MRRFLLASACVGWLSACSGTQTTASTGTTTPETPTRNTGTADLRALPSAATFGDIVRAARNLDQAEALQGEGNCLLRGSAPQRLSADLLLGIRPLPPPADDLAPWLEAEPGTPTLLTAWDRIGGDGSLVLAAFTTTTPAALRSEPVTVVLTARGAYVRSRSAALASQRGAMPITAAGALLAQLPATEGYVVYVSAEAARPVEELRTLLLAVPDRFEVALAVALPKGTQLPPSAALSSELMCSEGLPEPAEHEQEGSLQPQALREALEPLRKAALSCAASAAGRAMLGGRLVLALRIGAEGRITEACFSEDAIGSAELRKCLRASAQTLTLPPPSPQGFVDVALPLNIDLGGLTPQRGVCE